MGHHRGRSISDSACSDRLSDQWTFVAIDPKPELILDKIQEVRRKLSRFRSLRYLYLISSSTAYMSTSKAGPIDGLRIQYTSSGRRRTNAASGTAETTRTG